MNNLQHFLYSLSEADIQCCYTSTYSLSTHKCMYRERRRELIWHLTELKLVIVQKRSEWDTYRYTFEVKNLLNEIGMLKMHFNHCCILFVWEMNIIVFHISNICKKNLKLMLMMMNANNMCYCFLLKILIHDDDARHGVEKEMLRIHIN